MSESGSLVLSDATGVWAVRSASSTVYYLDTDHMLLLRSRGAGSPSGPGDNRWVPLLCVEADGSKVESIHVGRRHVYTYDFDPDGSAYGWWMQRAVVGIERLSDEAAALLPARARRDGDGHARS